MNWEKIGVVATAIGVVVAWLQLSSSIDGNAQQIILLKTQLSQDKNFLSTQAAEGWSSKPQLIGAKKIINSNTRHGRDYSSVASSPELNGAVVQVLNYLETLATGIKTSTYNDSILCNHLKMVVQKNVEVHILGQRPTGVDITNPAPFASSEYKNLLDMYKRWSNFKPCPST